MERTPRGSARRSVKTDHEDEPTTSSSKSPCTSRRKRCLDSNDSREVICRLLSQLRAKRDYHETGWKRLYEEVNPGGGNDGLQEYLNENMGSFNEHVQSFETTVTEGIPLEDLLKSAHYSVPETLSKTPSKDHYSPERKQLTLNPIAVTVDEPVITSYASNADRSLLAVNGPVSAVGPETNVEKAAKQEASVMARVAELRRNGMWTASLLPLCVEPPRNKTHWDYLLEEVVWMAHDFKQERRVKKNMANKISREIARGFRDKEREAEQGIEREKREAKRMCAAVAKMIREFWVNADKVVDFNARSILEAKKRRALDKHLSFIVGEADKISSMVQEGLMEEKLSRTPSVCSREDMDDAEFEVGESESDDETTIANAEKQINTEEVKGEVDELAKESNMEIDDLLASLPPEYLEALGMQPALATSAKDRPLTPESEEEADSESTSEEGPLAKRPRPDETAENEEDKDNNEDEKELEEKLKTEGNGDGRGMLENVDYAKLNSEDSKERQAELDNIAEEALKFQPKGFTLETTQVKTIVPFLIRGKLREYQMVGLDWLVTLYEKDLNGILADEMGLGKTIQTISLLAHLACSESIWGPHLIIVPTSVILNWEMEFKKWCPALKILTYFGSQKERAEKRRGWTKPNSFHVCITSYKTVTTDIRSFKMKAWQYMILDEAQNIKNWKSQRWQALLNVRARRRLLLTGTPLQNSLMELWSLMHFLMPAIFSSHDDFKDWFSNPLTGMMDGSVEFHAPLVQRLHKVLRPFILRRLKAEVEKQLPSKTEHIVKCSLSKRQRYLYDDFMSRRSTRDNLRSGNMMSVLNIVMQLRKCCNHPNLFEPRPVVAPFAFRETQVTLPGLIMDLCGEDAKIAEQKLIPVAFDLRKRMTGWSSQTESRRPLVQELNDHLPPLKPPKVEGFKFSRPLLEKRPVQSPTIVRAPDTPEEMLQDGNAPPLVPRPAATAPLAPNQSSPGTANDNNRVQPPASRPPGVVYGQGYQPSQPVNVHSPFRTNVVINPSQPVLNVEQPEDGFHNKMQSSGNVFVMRYQFSPPMKRRRKEQIPLVTGDYKELVSSNVLSRLQGDRTSHLERVRQRYGQLHIPFYPNELLTVLWNGIRSDSRTSDEDTNWRWNGWNAKRDEIDERLTQQVDDANARFLTYVHRAMCQPIRLSVTAGRPSYSIQQEMFRREASRFWIDREHAFVNKSLVSTRLQFPELRLIEYDCGKLQILGNLLRELFLYKHRCLIFTQMSRMLDVLQAFLSFHGYQYFRLDGTTPIEQRQAMMERFNADNKIFCFILSTRSGGVGVNLTGADTVIFYDSDWNPTMDAQAQDRCHRIGQTRNVSIYRLISERTIEENILKKATQKKRLGEMAIDDAGFTPEFFKKSDNIRDLFDGADLGGDDPIEVNVPKDQKELETAMASLEDEQDVVAARLLTAETRADRAEFDDTNKIGAFGADEPPDEKYLELIQQMAPIERYAVRFLEEEYKPDFIEELKEAEEMIEQKKTDWMNTQKAIEQKEDDLDDPLTYAGGNLLDEVRKRRVGRPSLKRSIKEPSRQSTRTIKNEPKLPVKTTSGRVIRTPTQTSAQQFLKKTVDRAKILSASKAIVRSLPVKHSRGRGRPRLIKKIESSESEFEEEEIPEPVVPKSSGTGKRGRPRKNPIPDSASDVLPSRELKTTSSPSPSIQKPPPRALPQLETSPPVARVILSPQKTPVRVARPVYKFNRPPPPHSSNSTNLSINGSTVHQESRSNTTSVNSTYLPVKRLVASIPLPPKPHIRLPVKVAAPEPSGVAQLSGERRPSLPHDFQVVYPSTSTNPPQSRPVVLQRSMPAGLMNRQLGTKQIIVVRQSGQPYPAGSVPAQRLVTGPNGQQIMRTVRLVKRVSAPAPPISMAPSTSSPRGALVKPSLGEYDRPRISFRRERGSSVDDSDSNPPLLEPN